MPAVSKTTDQRQHPRIPITHRVRVVAADRIIGYPEAINVSMSGILVRGTVQLAVGSACGVAILLEDGEKGKRVVTRGTVVRSDAAGLAIEFSRALDAGSFRALESLVRSIPAPQAVPSSPKPAPAAEPRLTELMAFIKPGAGTHGVTVAEWEPPSFACYEEIRPWLAESVMSATMYERYPDGRWTMQLLLKEQNPGAYRFIVL